MAEDDLPEWKMIPGLIPDPKFSPSMILRSFIDAFLSEHAVFTVDYLRDVYNAYRQELAEPISSRKIPAILPAGALYVLGAELMGKDWREFCWFEHRFKQTGNPVYAWEMYRFCRDWRIPMPEWVLAYFDSVANEFYMAWQIPMPPYTDEPREFTYHALGFEPWSRPFQEFHGQSRELIIACRVVDVAKERLEERAGMKDKRIGEVAIYEKVGEEIGLSSSAIAILTKPYFDSNVPPESKFPGGKRGKRRIPKKRRPRKKAAARRKSGVHEKG